MSSLEPVALPLQLNIAERFLTARLAEEASSIALYAGEETLSYADVDRLASRFGGLLSELGVEPEQRVLIALPDIPAFVGALFGTLKLGAVVVMVNRELGQPEIEYFYQYTRAKVAVVHYGDLERFYAASGLSTAASPGGSVASDVAASAGGEGAATDGAATVGAPRGPRRLIVVGAPEGAVLPAHAVSFEALEARLPSALPCYPTHRDDPAIWLFSGGTTGQPKAVVQSHRSFANTTELYARRTLGMTSKDITLSVPKLYFGYATGSNLLFPFSVGGSTILFPERCTAERLFELISRHRPTVLIHVPTMVSKMLDSPLAQEADLSCLRLATSAGEALPSELYRRWKRQFGVELLDGLGTAEMWHVFITNRLGDVREGTLGRVVEGFEVEVRDEEGRPLPRGETGWLWVRGGSRAAGYHQQHDKSCQAFRGEWYVSGDMISMDDEGYVTYAGRGDDMLKVGGKWLSPAQVEGCLLRHPRVSECAVVGVPDEQGLVKPHAFVLTRGMPEPGLEAALIEQVRRELEPYKAPRQVHLMTELPRTHLGKIDRGKLRTLAG